MKLRESWCVVANVSPIVPTDVHLKVRCNNESNDKRKHQLNNIPVHKIELRLVENSLVESNETI